MLDRSGVIYLGNSTVHQSVLLVRLAASMRCSPYEAETDIDFPLRSSDLANTKARSLQQSRVVRPVPISPRQDQQNNILVPVSAGAPWSHYDRKFSVDFGSRRQVTKSRKTAGKFMIRTVSGPNTEEHLIYIRSIRHPSLEHVEEIFTEDTLDGLNNLHIVTEYMAVSLLQVYRSPAYPTEPELSSILEQVS
ncbi:hypothetical protein CGMCC3_g13665 [Colletotrichum fructicola]|nr:uncharacterized protein CGMCC3_g13665 [Colletotrichum fructicola]KAE9570106.1 hypothetical protein CGMCC3_g13665 [Colletotrichum fructicola]